MSNPYQAPQPFAPVNPSMPGGAEREKMRSVARYQRLVMYALLANIGLNVLSLGLRGSVRGEAGLGVALAILAAALAIAAFSVTAMFLLANTLHNPVVGVICAVLMFVPCISLITLLIVNGQATSFLSSRGVKVGFMGVDPNTI